MLWEGGVKLKVEYDPLLKRELKSYLPIMDAIAVHFGKNCEVVLHDLSRVESSLVAMANNVTGRALGAPITNFVLEILQKEGNNAEDKIGYLSKTRDGKNLKSSTIFIRDNGKVVGTLCINYCVDDYLMAKNILENFCRESDAGKEKEVLDAADHSEYFANNVEEFVEHIIEEVLQQEGRNLQYLDKQDRVDLVRRLDEKGVFLVKGAIELVAARLGASKYTIYNYVDEVRQQDNVF